MVFDKTKAMRNAERFLAQGKIQSAIAEYKQVVSNDPKDFGTLNMLGDLYTKNSAKKEAVGCYTTVAEHYSKQGFAQKAIAVYNKISKIQGPSVEISAKLADLYKFKGSINEARAHYTTVAEHYESLGKRVEALEVRKQIASLDPNDTRIYLELAAAYVAEDQIAEAAAAFTEAGSRFAKKSLHTEALEAFEKALELCPAEMKTLTAFAQSHFALGSPAQAAERVAEIYAEGIGDRDVLQLLIDCHIEAGDTAEAEKAVIRLVELEPSSYQKFLELARLYLKNGDAESAARVTAISSEHLLLAGQAEDFHSLVTEILELDPEQIEGLRLRVRLSAWQRDESSMFESLERLAAVARERESVDDERLALSQLVMLAPHEVRFGERLKEINEQYGFDETYGTDNAFDQQFLRAPKLEDATQVGEPVDERSQEAAAPVDFALVNDIQFESAAVGADEEIESEDERLAREIESIRFYIDSEYFELASKAIAELRKEFGDQDEIDEIDAYLASCQGVEVVSESADSNVVDQKASSNGHVDNSHAFGIEDLRNELGIDEPESLDDSDYDTHYHTAVAYQEMGLLDDAIKEFQEAVGLVQPNDPSRRFFHCANLLGHCFMQKSMPNLALTWYQRALETPGLTDEEKQGIWYELAAAYEAEGDLDNAGRYFEQVYAENIDFRDVSERVRNLTVGR